MLIVTNSIEAENLQNREKEIFTIPNFIQGLYPEFFLEHNMFQKRFDEFYFVNFNNIFDHEFHYNCFINFISNLNESTYFLRAFSFSPQDKVLPIIKGNVYDNYSAFDEIINSEFILEDNSIKKKEKDFGLALIADFAITYGSSNKWGIVHDRYYENIIFGIDSDIKGQFTEIYNKQIYPLETVIKFIQKIYKQDLDKKIINKLNHWYR